MITTSTRRRQTRTKQSSSFQTETVQKQTFAILQHLFECSIAGICKDQRLFPDYFFVDYETNENGTNENENEEKNQLMVCKFDLEMLLDSCDWDDWDDSTKHVGSNRTHRTPTAAMTQHTTTTNDRTCRNSRFTRPTSLSPLTCSMMMQQSASIYEEDEDEEEEENEEEEEEDVTNTKQSSRCSTTNIQKMKTTNRHNSTSISRRQNRSKERQGIRQRNDFENDHHHEQFRTEALLLLHWIRHGVVEMMKRGQLARFLFAICSSSGASSSSSSSTFSSNDEEQGQDRIIESYAFDMTQLKLDDLNKKNRGIKGRRGGCHNDGGCINYKQMKNQYDSLFRNLQSLLRTSTFSQYHRHGSSQRMMMMMKSSQCHPSCHYEQQGRIVEGEDLMSKRYFNLRIEFKDPCTTQQQDALCTPFLPLAIDPDTVLNSLFVVADPGGENKCKDDSGRQKRSTSIPSIMNTINTQSSVTLGSVFEKNVTGIGVKVVTYQHTYSDNGKCEIETERAQTETCSTTETKNDGTFKKRKRDKIIIEVAEQGGNDDYSNEKIKRSTKKSCCSQSYNAEDDDKSTSWEIIENQSKAYAIPNYKRHTKNLEVERQAMFLPCIILNHRIRKKKTILDYKVLFFDPKLDEMKIKKQWISSSKVASIKSIEDQLYSHLDQLTTLEDEECLRDVSTILKQLALKLRVPLDVIRNDFGKELTGRLKLDRVKSFHNSSTNKEDPIFIFAKEPVTFIV